MTKRQLVNINSMSHPGLTSANCFHWFHSTTSRARSLVRCGDIICHVLLTNMADGGEVVIIRVKIAVSGA